MISVWEPQHKATKNGEKIILFWWEVCLEEFNVFCLTLRRRQKIAFSNTTYYLNDLSVKLIDIYFIFCGKNTYFFHGIDRKKGGIVTK